MSHFEAVSLLPTSASAASYSYLPVREQPSRSPRPFDGSRVSHRPTTHPATIVPARPRVGKQRRASVCPQELIALYAPVVNKIVGGFQRKLPRNVLREDLLAAGMIGLWDAIRRHGQHPDDGFEWYVRVRVRGAILDELRAQDWLPRRLRAAANVEASSSNSMPPSVVRIDDVSDLEQGRCLSEAPSGEAQLCARDEQQSLQRAVERLPERERHIIRQHYFKEVKFKDLSAELGVSEPRVSQLHTRAVQRLRELISAEAAG